MRSLFFKQNSNGFTLIEIIASIAILGMVIAVFLPTFPQMMSWTKIADDELVASNLLGQVAYDIKLDSETMDSLKSRSVIADNCSEKDLITYDLGQNYDYQENGEIYYPKVTICQQQNEQVDEVQLGLYRTRIQIYKENESNMLSDTYIYLSDGDAGA